MKVLRIVSGSRLIIPRQAYDKKNGHLLISVVHTIGSLKVPPKVRQANAKL